MIGLLDFDVLVLPALKRLILFLKDLIKICFNLLLQFFPFFKLH